MAYHQEPQLVPVLRQRATSNTVVVIKEVKGGRVSLRCYEVSKFSAKAVDQRINILFSKKKITRFLGSHFSSKLFLIKTRTLNKYSATFKILCKFSTSALLIFLEKSQLIEYIRAICITSIASSLMEK